MNIRTQDYFWEFPLLKKFVIRTWWNLHLNSFLHLLYFLYYHITFMNRCFLLNLSQLSHFLLPVKSTQIYWLSPFSKSKIDKQASNVRKIVFRRSVRFDKCQLQTTFPKILGAKIPTGIRLLKWWLDWILSHCISSGRQQVCWRLYCR